MQVINVFSFQNSYYISLIFNNTIVIIDLVKSMGENKMQTISESEFKKSIGNHIKKYRKQTQETLAENAQISPDTLSLIERGETIASSLTLVKICNALNITPNHILEDFIANKNDSITYNILNELSDLTIEDKSIILNIIISIKKLLSNSN